MFRFIDIYANQKVYFEEQVGTKKYWVFEGIGKYPYVTLISTKVVDKKNGFVYLQKLGKNTNYDNNKYGYCSEGCVTPNENVKVGEVFKKKVNAYSFKGKESYEYGASLYNPEKQYEEANWH